MKQPKKCPRCAGKMRTSKSRAGVKTHRCPDCNLVIHSPGGRTLRYHTERPDHTCEPETWIKQFQHGVCFNCQAKTCPYVVLDSDCPRTKRRLTDLGLVLYQEHHAKPKLARSWYQIAKQGTKRQPPGEPRTHETAH